MKMFRIPSFFQFEMSFKDAVQVMTVYGRGDLLEGMQALNRVWDEHVSDSPRFDSDSEFFECYEAEVNAYNVVFENMSKLFEKEAA
jgi:hypothetical protein